MLTDAKVRKIKPLEKRAKYADEKDAQVGVVGYEINFNRYFYVFEQPRHPNEIMAEIKELSAEVAQLLGEV